MGDWRESINPFQVTGLFLPPPPLKISENQRYSDVFRAYKKRPVAWNELKANVAIIKKAC